MHPTNEYFQMRKKKLDDLREHGIEPYPYSYDRTHTATALLEKYHKIAKGEKDTKTVAVAGRIMTLRPMGKAGFAHVQDHTGQIQVYIREDIVGKDQYFIFQRLDLGDIVGVKGHVFRTKLGEVSLWVEEFTLLAKSLRPLPEKWHGLKDMELRYRYRYLDLIANPEVKKIFETRSKIIDAMREFLKSKGFLEVDTPVLQPLYGGANARPFTTFLHDLKMDVYLRISDELYLKRLVIGGFDKVFEMGKVFRNESIDRSHNPEFTMMECYWAYADYEDMMELTEDLFVFLAQKVLGTTSITYQGQKIDLKKPWKRMTMKDAIKHHAKIDVDTLNDEELQEVLRNYNVEYEGEYHRGIAIELLFEELVEDKLIQPVFITDHPKESTPLCKPKRGSKDLIERFEPYITGMEFGNAYSELNDPLLQRTFFEQQAEFRTTKEEIHPVDEDFLKAVEHGMPPMGGLGIGIDRMVMLLTNSASIRDVLLFPFMKPDEGQSSREK